MRRHICSQCGRPLAQSGTVTGHLVPARAFEEGAVSFCDFEGACFNDRGRLIGYFWDGLFHTLTEARSLFAKQA